MAGAGPSRVALPCCQGWSLVGAKLSELSVAARRNKRRSRRLHSAVGKGDVVESTDVNFQVLRRTCATNFGAKAKDPRDTQAQLRHADPTVTLRHYQKSIPANVRAAAMALEEELFGSSANRSEQVNFRRRAGNL